MVNKVIEPQLGCEQKSIYFTLNGPVYPYFANKLTIRDQHFHNSYPLLGFTLISFILALLLQLIQELILTPIYIQFCIELDQQSGLFLQNRLVRKHLYNFSICVLHLRAKLVYVCPKFCRRAYGVVQSSCDAVCIRIQRNLMVDRTHRNHVPFPNNIL